MITEDYISFETAKLLKEKGFDEPCFAYYSEYWDNWKSFRLWRKFPKRSVPNKGYLNVPTLQMAMKWLREKYNLFIEIQCYGCEEDEKAHFEFSYVISEYVQFDNKICTTVGLEEKKAKSQFKSYEQACEAAIKYCLENLI